MRGRPAAPLQGRTVLARRTEGSTGINVAFESAPVPLPHIELLRVEFRPAHVLATPSGRASPGPTARAGQGSDTSGYAPATAAADAPFRPTLTSAAPQRLRSRSSGCGTTRSTQAGSTHDTSPLSRRGGAPSVAQPAPSSETESGTSGGGTWYCPMRGDEAPSPLCRVSTSYTVGILWIDHRISGCGSPPRWSRPTGSHLFSDCLRTGGSPEHSVGVSLRVHPSGTAPSGRFAARLYP